MKKFLTVLLSLFFIQGCDAQSQLPKEMPAEISVSLYLGGGMSRSYKKITLENGTLEFEELKGEQGSPQKESANISREDLAKLYQIFVENKFDTIKNDERKTTVYDAGSETISISLKSLKSFGVTFGKNSPLSGKNLRRYQAVRKAIYSLTAQYLHHEPDNLLNEDEAEKFIQGKWRAVGEHDMHTWFLEWTFDNGNFKQHGYPPLTQKGSYKIVSVTSNILKLELYDQEGTFGENNSNVEIVIDQKTNQLTISNMKGFSRIIEEKNR